MSLLLALCFSSNLDFSEAANWRFPSSSARWSGLNLVSVGGSFSLRAGGRWFNYREKRVKLYIEAESGGRGFATQRVSSWPESKFLILTDSVHFPNTLYFFSFIELMQNPSTSCAFFPDQPLALNCTWQKSPVLRFFTVMFPVCSTYIYPIIKFYTDELGLSIM